MRNQIQRRIAVAAIAILLSTLSFAQDSKAMATVNQKEGLYLFVQSKPAREYTFMGIVESSGMIKNWKEETLIDHMIKRTKKQYPSADAIIFVNGKNLIQVEAIKFK